MIATDIEVGVVYAIGPWRHRGEPMRPVTALRVVGPYLLYIDEHGRHGLADWSRVAGPWNAHAAAMREAEDALGHLQRHGSLIIEAAEAAEVGYAHYRVQVTCLPAQVRTLAVILEQREPPAEGEECL